MKYLKLEVTRESGTELYIEVPDDFNIDAIGHQRFKEEIGRIAAETTDDSDWEDWEWEKDVTVQSVKVVRKEEAEQYCIGTMKVTA